MAKTYYTRFGSGDPRTTAGLAPTFLIFSQNGTPVTPPSIAEIAASTGIYSFAYGTTTPIAFLLDGFTTGLGAYRYVTGSIDPADRADEYGNTMVSLGNTGIAITIAYGASITAQGVTILASIGTGGTLLALFGTAGSTFGGQFTDPIDLFGYMKRFQELMEGDNTYIKSTGVLDMYNRGSSTLLRAKTIANSVSTVIKTGQ